MNRSLTLCAFGAALSLLAACSSTGTSQTAGTDGATPARAVASNENVTCRNIIKTGTRLGTRVCKTDAQWKQESQDSRDAANSIQNNSAQSAGPAGG